jgi:hypothetical protein
VLPPQQTDRLENWTDEEMAQIERQFHAIRTREERRKNGKRSPPG